MTSVIDMNEYRRRKNLKRLKADLDLSSKLDDMGVKRNTDRDFEGKVKLKQYISLMRTALQAMGTRSGVIYVICGSDQSIEFVNEQGELMDYERDFGHLYEADYEKEDLVVVALINYAPSKIILRGSGNLHEWFLFTLSEIFEGVLQIET